MTLTDRFLAEHPFFSFLLEHHRRTLSHYLELYRCPKFSYLTLANEVQEVIWIVVRGKLAALQPLGQDQEEQETTAKPSSYNHLQPPYLTQRIKRYYLPSDLINLGNLSQEIAAEREIVVLEDDTQVLCMTAFHLAKLAQQHPPIHRALKPLYDKEGYLLSGLPIAIWEQMRRVPPPYTKNLGSAWQQKQAVIRSHRSWWPSIFSTISLFAFNIMQYQYVAYPYIKSILFILTLIALIFIILQRFRHEYILTRSTLYVAKLGLLGFRSDIKTYSLASIHNAQIIYLPLITKLLHLGGLKINCEQEQALRLFPIDSPQMWLEQFQKCLKQTQQAQQNNNNQKHKKRKSNLELVKEISYTSKAEGRLRYSHKALALRISPSIIGLLIGLYFSMSSPLLQINLTIPLICLGTFLAYQLFQWFHYSWYLTEDSLNRYDNFWGGWGDSSILLKNISNLKINYINILHFGTLVLQVEDRQLQIHNLKNPQNILEEIQLLRDYDYQDVLTDNSTEIFKGESQQNFLTYKPTKLYQPHHHANQA